MEATPPAQAQSASGPNITLDPRARLEILFAILLGLFLSALDQTIVGTALPRVVTDLKGNELYTWVVTIYLLTSTITGPIYGKLSDQFGRRNLLMVGIGLFLIGSFLSGLSQDMLQLILFRGIQGLGAGALFPIALAVIGDLFTPQERGKYQGLFGAVFGLSAIIGPFLGGWLTDNVSWHWVFFVNLPVGAVSMAIIWRLLPAHQRSGVTRKVDWLGVFVFTLALVPILIGLTNKTPAVDWFDPWVGGLIALGVVLLGVFIWIESRAAEPIMPLDLFRNRTYSVSLLAAFMASFGFFGAIIFLPRWYQVVNGSTATESGYQLLPLLAGLIGGSILSGQLVSRTGRYKLLTVASLSTLAVALFLLTNLRADTPPPVLYAWQFIAGVGIGPSMAVFTIIVQNSVPWQKMGAATSNLTFFRQIGGTVGLAIAGTVFGSTLQTEAPRQVTNELAKAGVPPEQLQVFADQLAGGFKLDAISAVGDMGQTILATVPEQFRAQVQPYIWSIVQGIHEAFSLAIASTMWLSVVATLVALAAVITLREVPLRSTHHAENPVARPGGAGVPATD